MTIEDFSSCHEFESIPVIMALAAEDLGITFAYETAAWDYLKKGILEPLLPEIFTLERQFTFVTLPDAEHLTDSRDLYELLRELAASLYV